MQPGSANSESKCPHIQPPNGQSFFLHLQVPEVSGSGYTLEGGAVFCTLHVRLTVTVLRLMLQKRR